MDTHSYARPRDARVVDLALDLSIDFSARKLRGSARLTVDRQPSATTIVLDTQDLTILGVSEPSGAALPFTLGADDPILGRALTVTLPAGREIVVRYETSESAGALQWLAPEQTAGKRHPFLYSQGQAILSRSWIPTQDSPGVRQTYSARLIVPNGLRAVMSAEQLTPEGTPVEGGRAFEFRLTQPIPAYLMALAVGDIAVRPLGPRTAVYAEPSVLDAAAYEFGELERMVAAAETLLGPYAWGRYDVLVLPPSFPFGGMENPRLTFATPTVLAGDRSLVSLIPHELAHSWSGNLVTNATWSDFWLNEGVTTYVELRIMEVLFGAPQAATLEVLGRAALVKEIDRLGGPASRDTVLHLDLEGRNPDDGATQIPYEKGAALMKLLELTVGRDRFDAFLRGYFQRHAFTSITTGAFLADVRSFLFPDDPGAESRLQLQRWIEEPGLPDNASRPVSKRLLDIERQAAAFAAGAPAGSLGADRWTTQEWLHFFATVSEALSPPQTADLDRSFGMSDRRNSEVLFEWLRLAIRQRYAPAMPALERFLTGQGRRKFLRPLYEDLMRTEWGRAEARRLYARARPLYHSVATSTLDAIVR